MDYLSIEDVRERSSKVVKGICRKFGIEGTVMHYAPSPIPDSDRNGLYIVAGLGSSFSDARSSDGLRPDELVRQRERNQKLFYPKAWAYDLLESNNDIQAQQDLVEYCRTTEFLVQLYSEYGAELPDRLRISEINRLIEYRSMLDNPDADAALKGRCRKALDLFFKREKTKNAFRKKWLSYYRSEHFPDNKGILSRFFGYFKRSNNQLDVKRMMEVNGELHKLEMQEFEYKIFVKLLREKHPDVVFSAGPKEIVDHGLINSPNGNGPFGRAVTGEEYAVIRKERFAKEGHAALADLRPSYWEFRDVYYKAVDEPLVAGVYNQILLSYAKSNSLMEMRERGDLKLAKIPVSDFMNFVSLAKANNLRFYIDNDGDFATPSLEFVNIIYNGHQGGFLEGIKNRMIKDKIEFSHVLDVKHPSLSSTIHAIEAANRGNSKPKDHSPKSYSR